MEGNAWNFSLFVPHDPKGMIEAMGGNKRFLPHLDSLFTMHLPDEFLRTRRILPVRELSATMCMVTSHRTMWHTSTISPASPGKHRSGYA
ncbi:glycoside hydrolase family 92 protein [Niabella hibiscisoli]|nr:glycoside hydrolase family 92 protein [Niabella hibiscisoli]